MDTSAANTTSNEIVYVLTNEAMPELVKIGRTTDLTGRMRDLYKTGVPLPFECHYAVLVSGEAAAKDLEKKLHVLFAENRINKNREFFRVAPERVVTAMSIGNFTPVNLSLSETGGADSGIDQADIDAVEKEEKRRERLKLSKIGIKTGSTLVFTRNESITCTTLENDKVLYSGQEMSLSAAALEILQTKYNLTGKSVNGSLFWMYEGETLDERRQRLDQETND